MRRKPTQLQKLRRLLEDGKPHSTPEIQETVYGSTHLGTARIASRVHDLRAAGLDVQGWKDADNPAIFWYQANCKPKVRMVPKFIEKDGVRYVRMVPETRP